MFAKKNFQKYCLFHDSSKNQNSFEKINCWRKIKNQEKISKIVEILGRNTIDAQDDEALYESSVRKLGWRFTARLLYWCVGKPRPKGTATFYNIDLFEHVSRRQNLVDMKMCHMESDHHVLKFDFGWVLAPDDNETKISIWRQLFDRGSFLGFFIQNFDFLKKSICFLELSSLWNFQRSNRFLLKIEIFNKKYQKWPPAKLLHSDGNHISISTRLCRQETCPKTSMSQKVAVPLGRGLPTHQYGNERWTVNLVPARISRRAGAPPSMKLSFFSRIFEIFEISAKNVNFSKPLNPIELLRRIIISRYYQLYPNL
jgi:hypothetical protein